MAESIDRLETLITDRLRLEPLRHEHVTAVLAYRVRNRAHLAPWEPSLAADALTERAVAAEIACSRDEAARDLNRRFAAFEDKTTTIVGEFNLWRIERGVSQSAILGYSIDAARQGRGYATEAAAAVVRHAFERLGLHRIATTYQPTNDRSGRVLRKLGFVVEGYARDYLLLDGSWKDAIFVALTNPYWTPRDDS